MTTETPAKQINWSAVLTAIGAVASYLASHLGAGSFSWENLHALIWPAVGVAIAAYKGTAKGSLSVGSRKPKPSQPVNDEGM